MELKLLSKISVRLISLIIMAQGVMQLPLLKNALSIYPNNQFSSLDVLLIASSFMAPVVVGLILWFLAPVVAKLMIGKNHVKPTIEKPTAFEIQAIAISTAGLIIVVLTLPMLLSNVMQALNEPYFFQEGNEDFALINLTNILASSLKLILGLLLMLGSPFWVRLLQKFRTLGLK